MKFFVISDVHGFYDEMRQALEETGFDPNNETHFLISCGDHWDRGPKPLEVMKYLMSLPRKVLISGNHESLFNDCCRRGYAMLHDYSNGTFDTICKIGGAGIGRSFDECCLVAEQKAKPFFDSMVNYFETKNYVFCHGYIPVNFDDGLPAHYRRNRKFSKMDNWREAHQSQWNDAMWLNSFDMVEQGFDIDKCVVAGHWHSSYGRYKTEGAPEFEDGADFSPFYYKDKLIMIDACTAYSHKVNCLVLEDVLLDD